MKTTLTLLCLPATLFIVTAFAFGDTEGDYYTNGIALAKKGDRDGAQVDFTKAIELDPTLLKA